MGATRSQLVKQYNRAKSLLWTEHFREAANTYTPDIFDTADLMAIGSRETNLDPIWLRRKGDGGHGAGLMQIDDRSFPEFTNSAKWQDARLGILYGAKVLRQKWDRLQKKAGHSLVFKNRYTFTGPIVWGLAAQQIAIAAYNSGDAAAYHFSKGRHPDHGTTGKDYSSDVIARARVFRELLAKDGMLDSAAASTSDGPSTVETGQNDPLTTGLEQSEPPPTESKSIFERLTDWTGKLNILTGFKDSLNPFTPSISPISGTSGIVTFITKAGGWSMMILGMIFNKWTALFVGVALVITAIAYLASAKRNAAMRAATK